MVGFFYIIKSAMSNVLCGYVPERLLETPRVDEVNGSPRKYVPGLLGGPLADLFGFDNFDYRIEHVLKVLLDRQAG